MIFGGLEFVGMPSGVVAAATLLPGTLGNNRLKR